MKTKLRSEDIQWGDFHIHTSFTDGQNSVREYCQRASKNRLSTIAFTEHVRKNIEYDYNELLSEILLARHEFKDIRILSGCEAKVINGKGELDAPEQVLRQCEVVVGVFHGYQYQDKKNYLEALRAMLGNPAVDIWGHPTLFAKRHGIKLDEKIILEIIDICLENDILIERNYRYNLPDADFAKLAIKRDVKFVVGSDAHTVNELLTRERLEATWRWIRELS